MKKIIIVVILVASLFVPVQNAFSNKTIDDNKTTMTLDFDDDDFPLFINF